MKTRFILWIFLGILLVFLILGLDHRLIVRQYAVETDAIDAPVRIALVTDLHSCYYGKDQKHLIETIEAQHLDFVLLGGDIFDDVKPDENTIVFLEAVSKKYPCYYVTGNHECWSGKEDFAEKMAVLTACGIPVLSGEQQILTVKGQTFNLCGVDDPTRFVMDEDERGFGQFHKQVFELAETVDHGNYTILLSHRPEFFELFSKLGFDLVLCGHVHGGQWRIPGLINGIYAPSQGLFPRYTGGEYQEGNTTMIISRGLARESTPIPRFYNRPELVIIELK